MKNIFSLLILLLTCIAGRAQSTLPEFSTIDDPIWYSVQFKTGGNYLSDAGTGNYMVTVSSASSDSEKFQFIGEQSNFIMLSKAGGYVNYDGTYFATTDSESSAATLAIIDGTEDNYFEIQRTSSTSNAMNQWGGTSTGVYLGEWSTGDTNNQLFFISQTLTYPEFSDEEGTEEHYYFVEFLGANLCMGLSTNDEDDCLRIYSADPVDGQLWKLVGTADNFQFVSKSGEYAVVSSQSISTDSGGTNSTPIRASSSEQSGGFSLQEAPNTDNGVGFEIVANSKSSSSYCVFNTWGATTEGTTIGLWSTNDANNVVTFVDPDDYTYSDYNCTGIEGYVPEHDLTLWYDEPATTATLYSGGTGYSTWMEYALPIGNGQFGACLFGGVMKDEIQFNEKTLWSGTRKDNSSEYGDYENFGSVYAENLDGEFGFASSSGPQNYLRQLDLTTGIGKVSYTNIDGSVIYTREYFASNPAQAVIAKYSASEAGKISLRFTLESGEPGVSATTYYSESEGEAYFKGKLETVTYNARIKVIPTGGEMTVSSEGIEVIGADEVLLILAGATNYDITRAIYYSSATALPTTVQEIVTAAAEKGWDALYAEHLVDFQEYFDRVDFQLEGTSNTVPTNTLIDEYDGGDGENALMLERLYFAYGRYLEICSSRGVDLPSNLQGIWNNMSEPSWNSDIHSNINVQMNYWPAEPTNLSEMHLPFLNYIWQMAENHSEWQGYAEDAGQSRGWTCYTENNIFGGVGDFMHNYVIANAWYSTHLWQHYRYTLDEDYLATVFPAMLSASQFWMDRLILADDGTYEAPDEYSPEHGPDAEDGVAHAQQLIYELFSNTLQAIEVLGQEAAGISDDDLETLNSRFANLDKGLATETYTGDWGTDRISAGTEILREWKYSDYTASTEGVDHRHMSHLMCLYPFSQVYPGTGLYDAAVNSLRLRGDGATGWSMGWKINLWARALDGDHARTILNNALAHSEGSAGVFYNLFDAHPPFQIDGNFGACAGIAEMLLQSNSDTIRVLPALPSAWQTGSITGLKAVKDFTVDIAWENGAATRITIKNNQGQTIPLLYENLSQAQAYLEGELLTDLEIDENGVTTLSSAAGTTYVFDFDGSYDPSGIEEAEATSAILDLKLSGRKVSITGTEVQAVRVLDIAGRTLMETTKPAFTIDQSAGHVFLLEITDGEGALSVRKVMLP